MLKLKLIHLMLYGVNGGRRFYGLQIKWLNKQRQALIGDIITIKSNNERVNVIDVSMKNIKLKQGVDLSFTSKSNDSGDDVFSNLYGLVDTGSDYSDLL